LGDQVEGEEVVLGVDIGVDLE
jgi:hypothetical protein